MQPSTDEQLIRHLFETQPDAVAWLFPIFEEGQVIDFEIGYCNAAAYRFVQASSSDKLVGARLRSSPFLDEVSIEKVFEQSIQVWQSGVAAEFTYHNPGLDRYFNVQRSKVMDGILSITRDRTHEVKLELEKQEQAELTSKIINASPCCIVHCQAIYNDQGEIDDFKLLMVNEKIVNDLKRPKKEIEGTTYCTLHPAVRENGLIELLAGVIKTGKPLRQEVYLEVFGGWFHLSADRLENDKLVAIYLDINKSKENARKVAEQAELLNKVLQHSPSGISWYEAIRENGVIRDFKLRLANQKAAEITAFSLEELYHFTACELMQLRSRPEFFDLLVRVVEKGEAHYVEFQSTGRNQWVGLSIVPFDDGYLLNYADITEIKSIARRNEEQALFLTSILDGSINGLFSMEGIADDKGQWIDLRITAINQAFTKILGFGEEVIGKRYLEVFPLAEEISFLSLQLEVLKTGKPLQKEVYYEQPGLTGWFRISISRAGHNTVVQTFTEISEEVRSKLQLEEAALHLQAVIDSTQTGIFLASPVMENNEIVDFRFKTVNHQLASYAGAEPHQLLGELHGTWFPVYKTNGVFECYKKVCETGQKQRFEKRYEADGFDVWMDVIATMLGNDLLVTFHDFTAVKQMQLQLENTVEDLKQTNERLSDFAHVASHDLKEPLRKVRMHTNFLEERYLDDLGEKGHQHVLHIQTATIRMQTLITDLLAYAQVSHKPDDMQLVHLDSVINEVLNDLETSIREVGAEIDVTPMPVIRGDATQLRQLFQNLLSNAIKFTDRSRNCHVQIRSSIVERRASTLPLPTGYNRFHCIEVQDNGIGFDPKYAQKLFKIFQRLHTPSEFEGTGIGLAIVQKVTENHRGLITAEGRPGEGACFKVYLPVNGKQ